MKCFLIFLSLLIILPFLLIASTVKYDNGKPKGIIFAAGREGWEESILLIPSGPCKVNKVIIYYSGKIKCKDTLYFCGFPTAGNLYPTEYIWSYNTLIDPVVVDYDGVEGWKEIDISQYGLKNDGIDKIVVQHKLKVNGPYFTFDSDGRQGPLSWYTDPFTPNSNFYNIEGTLLGLPEKINLIQPSDGAMDVPTKPQLNWQTSSSATSYWVQISESPSFDSLKFERQNSGVPPINVIPKLNDKTKYFWRVAGVNNAGRGIWSDVWAFTTTSGTSVKDELNAGSSENNFLVFPNPASNSLNIDISNFINKTISLTFVDEQGKLISEIFEGKVTQNFIYFNISTKNLNSGTYFIILQDKNNKTIKKLVLLF